MADATKPRSAVEAHDRDALVRQAELIISNVLRGGVLISAAIITIGVVMFYVHYFTTSAAASSANIFPATLGQVGSGLSHGSPIAIIMLGLLILLATPIFRVAVSIIAFALEHDQQYVIITLIVLTVLLGSFFFLGPALNLFSKR